jgi:hypothetical protein
MELSDLCRDWGWFVTWALGIDSTDDADTKMKKEAEVIDVWQLIIEQKRLFKCSDKYFHGFQLTRTSTRKRKNEDIKSIEGDKRKVQ